jgi:hypothetical protein
MPLWVASSTGQELSVTRMVSKPTAAFDTCQQTALLAHRQKRPQRCGSTGARRRAGR